MLPTSLKWGIGYVLRVSGAILPVSCFGRELLSKGNKNKKRDGYVHIYRKASEFHVSSIYLRGRTLAGKLVLFLLLEFLFELLDFYRQIFLSIISIK